MTIIDKPAVKGYQLLEPIGQGAYGVVHRARQPFVDRELALKVIRQLTPEERQRFGLPLLEE